MATILTNVGAAKLLAATPMTPVTFSHIAFGTGTGTVEATRTALVTEVLRVPCTFPVADTENLNVLKISGSVPRTFGPAVLTEIGIFDNTGALIAYGNLPNENIPTPTNEYGFSYTGTFRFAVANAANITVINADAVAFDHRGLTFRSEPDAHPASAITHSSGRTLESMFSANKIVSGNGVLNVGEPIVLSTNSTQTLPSTSGLALGSLIDVAKYSSVVATIQVGNTATEQIRVGGNSGEALDFDSILFDDYARLQFVWTGTVWECYF